MTQTEDRLRDAYRAVVQAVRPEDIPDRPQPRAHQNATVFSRRWAGLLIPLSAAAAVVVLVVTAAVLVPRLAAGPSHPRSRAYAPTAAGRTTGSLPEFSVVNMGGSLQVVDTATGRGTGTVRAPSGQAFAAVAGTAGDRTFLAAADLSPQTSCASYLYTFSLDGRGQPSALRPLPLALPAGVLPTALAVSADGSTAAFSEVRCATGNGTIKGSQAIGGIRLISLASGQVTRTWSYTLDMDTPGDLSLSADGGQLTFSTYLGAAETVAWMLPASAPSGPVATAGRVVVRQPAARYAGVDATTISADGRTLYICTHSGASPSQLSTTIAAYDASDGQLERVLHTWTAVTDLSCGLASNPADGYLLAAREHPAGQPPARSGKRQLAVDVQALSTTTGTVTVLPIHVTMPAGSGSIAW